jgi:hypothetical protein
MRLMLVQRSEYDHPSDVGGGSGIRVGIGTLLAIGVMVVIACWVVGWKRKR